MQRAPGPLNTHGHDGRGARARAASTTALTARMTTSGCPCWTTCSLRSDDVHAIGGQRRQLVLHRRPVPVDRAGDAPGHASHDLVLPPGRDHSQARVAEGRDAGGERLGCGDVDAIAYRRRLLPPLGRLLGLRPQREQPPRLVAAHGVDQHDTGGLIAMRLREKAREQPSVGVADEDPRRRDMGAVQQRREVGELRAPAGHAPRRRHTVAVAGAVVGAGPRDPVELRLDVTPAPRVALQAGREHDRRAAPTDAVQEEAAAAADAHQPARQADNLRRARRPHGRGLRAAPAAAAGREGADEQHGESPARHDPIPQASRHSRCVAGAVAEARQLRVVGVVSCVPAKRASSSRRLRTPVFVKTDLRWSWTV